MDFVYSDIELEKNTGRPFAIIKNTKFYAKNKKIIGDWLLKNNGSVSIEGTVIFFKDKNIQTMFKMRWED